MIEEAKKEEIPYIKDDKIIFKDINERKITNYFYTYYNYLLSKKISSSSIKSYLKTLRAFYNEYDVQLPKNIAIKKLKVIIKEGDIPKIQDIEKGVGSTNNLRDKVIILFIASSGMITGDLRRLKISDFLEATKDYHNSNNIKELLNNMGC